MEREQMSADAAPCCTVAPLLLPPRLRMGSGPRAGPGWLCGEGCTPSCLLCPSASLSGEQIIERGLPGALIGNSAYSGTDEK